MNKESHCWFPAKRYGWGWSFPTAWQGWIVLVSFLVLLALGAVLFPPITDVAMFLMYSAALSVLLVVIGYLKGEPPAWRWGGR